MKKARLILSASMLSIAAFSAVTFTSCSKDDEPCPLGMEGNDCDVEIREKFLGTWTAQDQEVDGSEIPAYNAVITKNSSSITKLNIGGFSSDYFVNNVVVTASGMSFDILNQDPDGDGYTVEGEGTINSANNQLSVQYTITQPVTGSKKSYTGIWTK